MATKQSLSAMGPPGKVWVSSKMAKQLVVPVRVAKIGNTDLSVRLDFRSPSDSRNVVLGDMKFTLLISNDDGTGGSVTVKVTDHLSGKTLTDFRAALATLRDASFVAGGYVDV